jgi:hypothetical protein
MRSIIFLSLSALAAIAVAATKENPFNIPADGYEFSAGEPTTLTWDPTTSGTVTLKLQWGDVFTSDSGSTIVCKCLKLKRVWSAAHMLTYPSKHSQFRKLHLECSF